MNVEEYRKRVKHLFRSGKATEKQLEEMSWAVFAVLVMSGDDSTTTYEINKAVSRGDTNINSMVEIAE